MDNRWNKLSFNLAMVTIIATLMYSTLGQKNPYYIVWTWLLIAMLVVVVLAANDD